MTVGKSTGWGALFPSEMYMSTADLMSFPYTNVICPTQIWQNSGEILISGNLPQNLPVNANLAVTTHWVWNEDE